MHPVTEFVLATAIVCAVGAGAVVVLPQAKPAEPRMLALETQPQASSRAAPAAPQSDAERVEALQADLAAIAAEHKRLAAEVRRVSRERKTR